MPHKLILKPQAEEDLKEAVIWYENQKLGLGKRLFEEISNVMDDILNHPESYQKRYKSIRIRYTKIFNFGIHYTFVEGVIYIHAIYHTSRIPRD